MFTWNRTARIAGRVAARRRRSRVVARQVEGLEERCLMAANLLLDVNNANLAPAELTFVNTAAGPRYFYTTTSPSGGTDLYVTQISDQGVASGTTLLHSFPRSAQASDDVDPPTAMNLTAVGNRLYFRGEETATGAELWRSDGTPGGTVIVQNLNPGAGSSRPTSLTAWGNTLYFTANDGTTGISLWRSDDATGGATTRLTGLVNDSNPLLLTVVGNPGSEKLAFAARVQSGNDGNYTLYAYDGNTVAVVDSSAAAGVQSLQVNVLGSSAPDTGFFLTATEFQGVPRLATFGGKGFLVATNGATGSELWSTDGTTAGTALAEDITPGTTGTLITRITPVSDGVFFAAERNGVMELWKSNGTDPGTGKVKDLFALNSGLTTTNFNGTGSRLYFTTTRAADNRLDLWTSNGTDAGTVVIAQIDPSTYPARPFYQIVPHLFAGLNGTLYFTNTTAATGTELWKSDGTAASTVLVKDILPGAGGSSPRNLDVVNGRVFFAAAATRNLSQLWRTDGTANGTQAVLATPNPVTESSFPQEAVNYGGLTLFTASDGGTGGELWRTDGTAAGTFLVKDIRPGGDATPNSLTLYKGLVYFLVPGTDALSGLWRSDGTAAGTVQVAITPGLDKFTDAMVQYRGFLFFGTHNPATRETQLWRSDGTPGGTVAVRTFNSGGPNSIDELTVAGDQLFFTVADGAAGREVWRFTINADGSSPIAAALDINNAGSSNPKFLTAFNNRLYFVGNGNAGGGFSGDEIWSTAGAAPTLLADLVTGSGTASPANLTAVGPLLFFTATNGGADTRLWATNGTDTKLATAFAAVASTPGTNPTELVRLDESTLLYTAESGAGRELWRFRTATGEQQLADINAGGASAFTLTLPTVVANGRMYFAAQTAAGGRELWRTDGTPAGTLPLHAFAPGTLNSNPRPLLLTPGGLLVGADDGLRGDEPYLVATGQAFAPVGNPLNDFNGDGKSDYAVYRLVDNDYAPQGTTKWFTIQNGGPSGAEVYDWARQWGISSDTPVPGDYNGDGKADYTVFRTNDPFGPATGLNNWYIALNQGNGVNVKPMRNPQQGNAWPFPFGLAGDIPVPGDYNGDGKDDLALYRPSNGRFYVVTLGYTIQNGEYFAGLAVLVDGLAAWDPGGVPITGGQPVSGDFNGDGRADFAVYHTGAYHIRLNLPDNTRPYTFAAIGQAGDKAISGDFDGDGRTDLVLYRPDVLDLGGGLKVAGWYVWNNLALDATLTLPTEPPAGNVLMQVDYNAAQPGVQPFFHGLSADTPISADVNGDKRSDFMVFRPDDRTVFVPGLGNVTVAAWYTLTNLPGNTPGQWDWGRLHGVRTDNPIGRNPLVPSITTASVAKASVTPASSSSGTVSLLAASREASDGTASGTVYDGLALAPVGSVGPAESAVFGVVRKRKARLV